MGPDGSVKALTLPTRPRFSWDIRSVPWTDGRGDQLQYSIAVRRWAAFHDSLLDSNSNKIQKKSRAVMLLSNLYERAADLARNIEQQAITAEDGTQLIINAVYKVDALSTVSLVFHELQTLLSTKRGANESFRNFESRFNAALCRYNSLGDSVSMSEPMAALYLLANANVDSSQRVSILASAASNLPNTDDSSTSTATSGVSLTTDKLVSQVSYEGIASVLRQCDQPRYQQEAQYQLMERLN